MKILHFRPVRRWRNGAKFEPHRSRLRKTNALLSYWDRVGQWGSFRKPKRK